MPLGSQDMVQGGWIQTPQFGATKLQGDPGGQSSQDGIGGRDLASAEVPLENAAETNADMLQSPIPLTSP